MANLNPRLTSGVASNQSIYETVSTNPRHAPGTRGITDDGRVFRYACNRGTAIGAGLLVKATEISVDFDDLATATTAAGETAINVTPVGTATYAANELAGGFVQINSGSTGLGMQYRIVSHAATAAATAFDLVIDGQVEVALDATATATVVPNHWSNVAVADGNETQFCAGATPVAVGTGTDAAPIYFWAQVGGTATVLADAASIAIGQAIQVGGSTAGAFGAAAEAAGTINQVIGTNLFTTVDGDYMPVHLNIAG